MNQDDALPNEGGQRDESAWAELEPPSSSAPVPAGLELELSEAFSELDPRNIKLEMITGLIFATVLFAGLVVATIIVLANLGLGWIVGLVAGVELVITLVTYCFALFWPRLEHNRASYRVDNEGLEIRRGVLWRHQITVPMGRVQHADVSQGPIQRMFELGTLTVHTAGTQNASVSLEGLAHERAIQIRDLIVHYRKEHDAV